jgi:hypothetical protein
MSLTQLLIDDHVLRAELRVRFQYPRFPVVADMVAPPLCTSYSTVGTAVDYLLRGRVQYLNPERTLTNDVLVAEYAYALLRRFLRSVGKGRVALGRTHNHIVPAKKVLASITAEYALSLELLQTLPKHGRITDEVAAASLFLARLDPFFRAGVIDPGLIYPDEQACADVKQVLAHTPDLHFTAKRKCYLNPVFGIGSQMVGGADADLIMDDLLVDIKTTKDLCVSRRFLDQLLCYYTLHTIGGINDKPRVRPIKRVGIYFSRHGYLWSVPVNELASRKALVDFKKWFVGRYAIRK